MSQLLPTKINCYPSLDSHAGALTDPTDAIPAILKHILATPGNSSNIYENTSTPFKLSFSELVANFGNEPKELCSLFANNLLTIFNRYYPQRTINVLCDYELHSDNVRYDVVIDIQERLSDATISPLLISQKVTINPKTNEININYGEGNV